MAVFSSSVGPEAYALVRFGYGWPALGAQETPQGLLSRLKGPDTALQAFPKMSFADGTRLAAEYTLANRAAKGEDADEGAIALRKDLLNRIQDRLIDAVMAETARIASTDDPFRERLVQFWSNHFAVHSRGRTGMAMGPSYSDEAIRPHITGRFADLLIAAGTHPVMLQYLDQTSSVGPNSAFGLRRGKGLNENLAREMLELHTLGAGAPYTQADVRQFAELLTGLAFNFRNDAATMFDPELAEPGSETVLGNTYGGGDPAVLEEVHAALEDIAVHPATAAHLSRKIAAHFVADTPPEALVTAMTAAWRDSGGDLTSVYQAMLDHPAAWSDFGGKVKKPYEFITSALRALEFRGDVIAGMKHGRFTQLVIQPLRRMGHPYMQPAGPDGFPDDAGSWVQPYGIAQRISWAMEAADRYSGKRPDPMAFAETALGGLAGPNLLTALGGAETRKEAVGIVLASAEFNRR